MKKIWVLNNPKSTAKILIRVFAWHSSFCFVLSCCVHILQITKGACQIVSFGAGFDTLYWLLKDEGHNPMSFIEVDFSTVTAMKIAHIRRGKNLLEKMSDDGNVLKLKLHKNEMQSPTDRWAVSSEFVFEHSVMTNFNCACLAIQMGEGSGFLFEGSP